MNLRVAVARGPERGPAVAVGAIRGREQNTVGHRWRRTREAAGLGALRLHDLRHFFASGLINAGSDVVTVQHALGHSKAASPGHLLPPVAQRRGPDARCRSRSDGERRRGLRRWGRRGRPGPRGRYTLRD